MWNLISRSIIVITKTALMKTITLVCTAIALLSCENANSQKESSLLPITPECTIKTEQNNLGERFLPPGDFHPIEASANSFAQYLRELPLLPNGSPVLLYNGEEKYNQSAHLAVIDLPIGQRDLHQCADAVMRLRAEYLWEQKEYDRIHFNFTNGFRADYDKWRKGQRIKVSGNKVYWTSGGRSSNDYETFWKYLEMVYSYAGTLSLSRELKHRPMKDMQIGDVLIQGGSPGHAVTVVNMAENDNGQKLYMLAQSYMPAQQIQILKNPNDSKLGPWYVLDDAESIRTPEWTFSSDDLMYFE